MTSKEEYLAILLGKENISSIQTIQCDRAGCDSSDIKTWEWATRAADEGVTIFHKCRKCKYVWMEQ